MIQKTLLVAMLLVVTSLFLVAEEVGQIGEVGEVAPAVSCEQSFEKCVLKCGNDTSGECEEKCVEAETKCNEAAE